MKIKRALALSFAFIGITLAVFSLTIFQSITGAVVGANPTSKFMGVVGVLFMVIAVIIEKVELKKK